MSVASPDPTNTAESQSKISYRFCAECSNLLYPREDSRSSQLIYICKACTSAAPADPGCTYRQILSEAAQESMGEKAYVSNDPTLPHENRECPKCHETDVVYFQSQQRKGDIGMSLYYVCTNPSCNNAWNKTNESK